MKIAEVLKTSSGLIKFKQTTAFTLAEVLITLMVIGFVAEMTIPTLIANTQKAEYVAMLEKATSTLDNGFKQIMANTGCSDIPCTGIIGADPNTTLDNIKASNIFSIIKTCHIGETGCDDAMVYYMNNTQAWVPSAVYSMFILKDGTIVGFHGAQYPNCDNSLGNNQYSSTCSMYNIIDVNGIKPPNIFGRDIFRFYLSKYGTILPVGAQDDTSAYGYWNSAGNFECVLGGDGETCFGRIVEQGWQMNY